MQMTIGGTHFDQGRQSSLARLGCSNLAGEVELDIAQGIRCQPAAKRHLCRGCSHYRTVVAADGV